ncbi:ceramidase domain-containing protein [Aureimonas sp. N4]|uniref:ceramidase domain-containing protein n=1 Tax=Aureimonas sp. N4 TaxID=1638165 RepID=UPI0007815286|nr:ceramidase domain-containing protein [Aureimonas sp. N4]
MDWATPIDAYCERTSAAFWSEPVNALTNLAFLLAALWAFRRWRARGGGDRATLALIGLVGVIGVGSFLFHTFANRWSALADVLPIALFIFGFFTLALRRLIGLSWPLTLLGLLAFVAFDQFVAPLAEPLLGSSEAYLPALLALYGMALWLMGIGRKASGLGLLSAGAVFTLSLLFRMADGAVCPSWPLGTHFLWHGLNAVTLALCLRVGMAHEGRATAQNPA